MQQLTKISFWLLPELPGSITKRRGYKRVPITAMVIGGDITPDDGWKMLDKLLQEHGNRLESVQEFAGD